MSSVRPSFLVIAVTLGAAWALAEGCSATHYNSNDVGGGGGSGGSGGGKTAGAGGSGGDCVLGCGNTGSTGSGLPQELTITPPMATLTVVDGVAMNQPFTVAYGGADVTAQVQWTFDTPAIGDVPSGTSTFTPTGTAGGAGTLTATLSGKSKTATVVVSISKTVNGASLDPAGMASFDAPGSADPGLSVVYPYDATVFPLDVLAPDMQWNGSAPGDVYRLKITEKYFSYVEYFTADPPSHHTLADADWATVEGSGSGAQSDPVTIEIARKSGGSVFQGVKQTWHIAPGRLKGSVYYWELPDQCGNGNGRILRIKPSSATVDAFFDPGTCWGCHTVSRDGKQLAAEFNDGDGPLGTLDLSANPVVYGGINPNSGSGNYIFSAFNDTGDKLLASNNDTRQLDVISANGGTVMANGVLGNSCGEPAWSPDGKKIAGICNMNGGGWTFDSGSGDLMVADIDPSGTQITNAITVAPQSGGNGRPAYPTFSPGSGWLAYGRPTAGSRSTDQGTLWMVKPDGSGLVELNTAGSDGKSFNPVFAPLRAGGFYWIVFVTRRDYGNQIVGANRQQAWIAAIDDPPIPGVDPSHPPFYLRGQEPCAKSENAYFALDPCQALGAGCTSGVDCCGGQCVKDPMSGMYVCGTPPPPGMCSANGNACKVNADCCDPTATCLDGFCQTPIPH